MRIDTRRAEAAEESKRRGEQACDCSSNKVVDRLSSPAPGLPMVKRPDDSMSSDIAPGGGSTKMEGRYYQPELGRWTQRDPSGQEANAYLYVGGDPANFADSSGLSFWYTYLHYGLVRSQSTNDVPGISQAAGAAVGSATGVGLEYLGSQP